MPATAVLAGPPASPAATPTTLHDISQSLVRYRREYNQRLLIGAVVRVGLAVLCVTLGALGALRHGLPWWWPMLPGALLACGLMAWDGWRVRRRWLTLGDATKELDRRLHLKARLITSVQWADQSARPRLYEALQADLQRQLADATTQRWLPRRMNALTYALIALAVLLLAWLVWPRPPAGADGGASTEQGAGGSTDGQGGSAGAQSGTGGPGGQPGPSGAGGGGQEQPQSGASGGQGQQQSPGAQSGSGGAQQNAGQQGSGTQQQGSSPGQGQGQPQGSGQQQGQSQDRSSDGSQPGRPPAGQQAGQPPDAQQGQQSGAQQGQQQGQSSGQQQGQPPGQQQGQQGAGQAGQQSSAQDQQGAQPSGSAGASPGTQQLQGEVQDLLQQLSKQLEQIKQPPPPEMPDATGAAPGTNTDEDLFAQPEALPEQRAADPIPLTMEGDASAEGAASQRKALGPSQAEGPVEYGAQVATQLDDSATVGAQQEPEAATARRYVPGEYQKVIDQLHR